MTIVAPNTSIPDSASIRRPMDAVETCSGGSSEAAPVGILISNWKLVGTGALAAGVLAFAATFLIPPVFTAKTVILPPQQQQGGAAAALASLGALAGLAGGGSGPKNQIDQYVALFQSANVSDRIIKEFDLIKVYDVQDILEARKLLGENARIYAGKKDGLINIEIDDEVPERSASMANAYVGAFRALNASLAISEAQQRRAFFEEQLANSKKSLTAAQVALQGSGFNASALKAEPQAEAENFARLRAEITSSELRLQSLRQSMLDSAPEVQTLKAQLAHLRREQVEMGTNSRPTETADYISRFREFKYQETLFQLLAQQFEMAKVDESRDGALVQVVDAALPPTKKSKPKRGMIAIMTTFAAGIAMCALVLLRERARQRRR